MAFKLITVLCATLAYANAGLLASTAYSAPAAHYAAAPVARYSPATEVSHVYSSIGYVSPQPAAIVAHAAPVLAAPAVTKIATPVVAQQTYAAAPAFTAHSTYSAPAYAHSTYAAAPALAVAPAVKTYAAAPVLHAPIAKVAYSPATEVSHVYSSIGAAPVLAAAPAVTKYATPVLAQQTYAAAPAFTAHSTYAAPSYAYGIHSPAIGSSQQSTIRTHGGTISTYSKAEDTAFSSVRKSDTRISNNVYTPALATKTIAYQQPAYVEQKQIPATVVSHVAFDGIGAHYAW